MVFNLPNPKINCPAFSPNQTRRSEAGGGHRASRHRKARARQHTASPSSVRMARPARHQNAAAHLSVTITSPARNPHVPGRTGGLRPQSSAALGIEGLPAKTARPRGPHQRWPMRSRCTLETHIPASLSPRSPRYLDVGRTHRHAQKRAPPRFPYVSKEDSRELQ